MSETSTMPFAYRHNNVLPKSWVRGLCIGVTLAHCLILGWIAQGTMETVAIEPGGGGGGAAGQGVIQVSVLQVPKGEVVRPHLPEPQAEQMVATDTEEADSSFTVMKKETAQQVKPAQETAASDSKAVEKTPAERAATGGVGAGRATGQGSGSDTGSGTGTGSGAGTGTGSGTGSGAGQGAGVVKVAISALRYRNAVKPYYPEESIERRETGAVYVRVVVGTDGAVKNAGVEKSSGFRRLDNAALTAAKRSTFYPYMSGGAPVAVMASIPYHFNLAR
ncbi:MAG: energy transducer TonB [Oxalobacter sp.]|nr:energy transducer TonB [Oxalobacter sp.]